MQPARLQNKLQRHGREMSLKRLLLRKSCHSNAVDRYALPPSLTLDHATDAQTPHSFEQC
jgi:hypothetical protein